MTGGTERAEKSLGALVDHPIVSIPGKHSGIALLSISTSGFTYRFSSTQSFPAFPHPASAIEYYALRFWTAR